MKIADELVQIGSRFDEILGRPCFPVNMELLKTSGYYFHLIETVVSNMIDQLQIEFDDYPELQGLSGANIGVPFNIVLIKTKDPERPIVMLNPEIIDHSLTTKMVSSNCGSLNLPEAIKVERYDWVKVKYYPFDRDDIEMADSHDEYFQPTTKKFKTGTVQHEIDHNKGILITDRSKQ